MTVEKGREWGSAAPLPENGFVVRSDAEASSRLEAARRAGTEYPVIGLLGGDLCRTLGGIGSVSRLRSDEARSLPVDVGQVLVDGKLHLFVAHVVARSRSWRRAVVIMNAQWLGRWDVAPRAHPNDGLLDVLDARLRWADLFKVRSRLAVGAHLPHPDITERRVPAVQMELDRSISVWVDGSPVGRGRTLSARLESDALTVVV